MNGDNGAPASNAAASKARGVTTQYRLGVAARAIGAIFGGYAFSALLTASLSLTLPLSRPEAVQTATMLSFAAYALAVMWMFAARTARRAWIGLLAASALAGAGVLLAPWIGGGA